MPQSKLPVLASPPLQRYFEEYERFHQTRGNKITHYFGIFFIVVSLLGVLGRWAILEERAASSYLVRLDGGVILLAVTFFWYMVLDWKIAVPFCFMCAGLYFLGRAIPTPVCLFLFIFGWVLQLFGHAYYEKRSPAFAKNLVHLLIGPLWIFSRVVRYR